MSTRRLALVADNTTLERARARPPALRDMRPLGQVLIDMGVLGAPDLDDALERQRRLDAPLGDILVAAGLLSQPQLQAALAEQHALRLVDFETDPPDPASAHLLSGALCVKHRILPWLQFGDVLMVATARPDLFDKVLAQAPRFGLTLLPVLVGEAQLDAALMRAHGPALARRAETRVAEAMSCRTWERHGPARRRIAAAATLACAVAALLLPGAAMALLTALAGLLLLLSVGLKTAAAAATLRADARPPPPPDAAPAILRLPKVSVMVPLLRETEIAAALLKRLSRLTYPKAQLDIVLVLEAQDHVTAQTLARTDLPAWVRVLVVPHTGGLLTKPRALNYALDFCHGSIIGIWDAEDAPAPDQIETVVQHFHMAAPEVVCVQGRLDYYNPRGNWMARCFTIEYATWWRLVMPGLERLGCVIPLGGTTLFFKRAELEALGGWDAHNVTEDADLGLRLARAGYRTEMIDTTTWEEANCRPWPWIKQRSRWLKGFAVTWIVHMRRPRVLLRDLGWYRFAMLQVFFAVALAPFLLAPVFWSYLALSFGAAHPGADWPVLPWLLGGFGAAEAISLGLHMLAVRRRAHRHLLAWAPTMTVYFLLGTVAAYKAAYELIFNPFFWDKTEHGVCPTVRFHLPDPDPEHGAPR